MSASVIGFDPENLLPKERCYLKSAGASVKEGRALRKKKQRTGAVLSASRSGRKELPSQAEGFFVLDGHSFGDLRGGVVVSDVVVHPAEPLSWPPAGLDPGEVVVTMLRIR